MLGLLSRLEFLPGGRAWVLFGISILELVVSIGLSLGFRVNPWRLWGVWGFSFNMLVTLCVTYFLLVDRGNGKDSGN